MEETQVQVFKISTGEEVISRVISEEEEHFLLEKPRVVAISPANGQMSITLIPLFASNQDGNAILNKSQIVGMPQEINDELEKGYIEQTSGIAIA